jgi:hypothetical protein
MLGMVPGWFPVSTLPRATLTPARCADADVEVDVPDWGIRSTYAVWRSGPERCPARRRYGPVVLDEPYRREAWRLSESSERPAAEFRVAFAAARVAWCRPRWRHSGAAFPPACPRCWPAPTQDGRCELAERKFFFRSLPALESAPLIGTGGLLGWARSRRALSPERRHLTTLRTAGR